ncbi:MAG TPA: hypothetical protein VGO40_24600 [Longimicrobium sp.]|jgi:hypothetical protein|nr:hypothetical protein [Longimicrobium sp.]
MHANTSSTPVFRTIDVATDVPITLGEPLSGQAMALMQQVGPQRFKLKPGTFANAKEIDIQLTVGAAVQQMDFRYTDGSNYQEMVADFEAEIGPPTRHHGSGDDMVTVWQDDDTEFRLVGGASGIRSKLRDRAPTSAQATA